HRAHAALPGRSGGSRSTRASSSPARARGAATAAALARRSAVRRGRRRILILNQRVQDLRILLVDVEADAAQLARWQSAAELRPFLAGIVAAIDRRLGPALDDLPRLAIFVVHRRIENRRRLAVDHEIDRADRVVDVERFLPGLAAVDGLEHA